MNKKVFYFSTFPLVFVYKKLEKIFKDSMKTFHDFIGKKIVLFKTPIKPTIIFLKREKLGTILFNAEIIN